MPSPSEELAEHLASLDLPSGVNIYAFPTDKVEAPAIVIRPDTPWFAPSSFCFAEERYLAICAVSANTPGDGIVLLRLLTLAIIGGLVEPWDYDTADGPIIDDTTGQPFLANRIRLTYKVEAP